MSPAGEEDPGAPDHPATGEGPDPAHDQALPHTASRRTVLAAAAGVVGAVGLAACTTAGPETPSRTTASTPESDPSTTTARGSATGPATAPPVATPVAAGVLTTSGPDLQTGPKGKARVALTFHGAGPSGLTMQALSVARAHQAKLTVFAVGQWLDANPELGRAILADGHDLGNHTWSHQPMRRLSAAQADLEVSHGAAAVAAVRGSAGLLFRPSGTPSSTPTIRAAALAAGYHRCISYDVDPSDYLDPGSAAVRDRTLAAVRDGSIVSLHLGHAGTVAALPAILDGLHQRGLTAVTITELLGGT